MGALWEAWEKKGKWLEMHSSMCFWRAVYNGHEASSTARTLVPAAVEPNRIGLKVNVSFTTFYDMSFLRSSQNVNCYNMLAVICQKLNFVVFDTEY